MDEDEVDRLRKEAEKFADSDKEKVEQVQVRNELDSMVYQCEKQLSDLGDKAPKELKESIDGILSNSKKVLENQGASLSELKEAKDSLQKTFEQLGQEAMKQQNAGSTGPVPGGPSEPQDEDAPDSKATDKKANEDDIVDADFEVVDEADKKD
jgi:molecular chaperone DnaK